MNLSIGEIFIEAFVICWRNPSIIIPALIPGAWLLVMSIILTAAGFSLLSSSAIPNPGMYLACLIGWLVGLLIFRILFLFAKGMIVEMARQAYEEGEADLRGAFETAMERFLPLLIGTVFAGLLVSAGLMALILPGIILAFALWFVPQAIMIDYKGPISGVGASMTFFGENWKAALVLALLSLVLYDIILFVSWIPVLGTFLVLIGMPYLVALTTVLYIDRA